MFKSQLQISGHVWKQYRLSAKSSNGQIGPITWIAHTMIWFLRLLKIRIKTAPISHQPEVPNPNIQRELTSKHLKTLFQLFFSNFLLWNEEKVCKNSWKSISANFWVR